MSARIISFEPHARRAAQQAAQQAAIHSFHRRLEEMSGHCLSMKRTAKQAGVCDDVQIAIHMACRAVQFALLDIDQHVVPGAAMGECL
ncbi:MAG: hypothetical protein EPN21_00655 [Methylococcaceae bacterium]|nr:MAG: hypothetical protein EPN21_00655 [Methylococcaceae bacterium]